MDGNLRQLFRRNLPDFHWVSIESGQTGGGIPDANYCHKSTEGWVEFKQTKGFVAGLRPNQVAWIDRRVRAGGRVFVAVRRKPANGATDELWLIRGAGVTDLARQGLKKVAPAFIAGAWEGGPARWGWAALRGLLLA